MGVFHAIAPGLYYRYLVVGFLVVLVEVDGAVEAYVQIIAGAGLNLEDNLAVFVEGGVHCVHLCNADQHAVPFLASSV